MVHCLLGFRQHMPKIILLDIQTQSNTAENMPKVATGRQYYSVEKQRMITHVTV